MRTRLRHTDHDGEEIQSVAAWMMEGLSSAVTGQEQDRADEGSEMLVATPPRAGQASPPPPYMYLARALVIGKHWLSWYPSSTLLRVQRSLPSDLKPHAAAGSKHLA